MNFFNNFIIVYMQGGLGNQLYQFAFGKALSKMKNYTVNVFDQCIAFNDDNSPSEFEISLELTKHGTDKKRVMHLTGIISESETVRNANQQKMQSA